MSYNRIIQLRGVVADFEADMVLNLKKIIWANEAYIIDMNATDQLYEQGINNLGVDISDYAPYSPLTIEIKKQKNQPYNRVTLHDEGEFAGSFFLVVGDNNFEIKAGDWKTQELIKKYGRQILGLTDDNIARLIWSYVYPDLCDTRDYYFYGNY